LGKGLYGYRARVTTGLKRFDEWEEVEISFARQRPPGRNRVAISELNDRDAVSGNRSELAVRDAGSGDVVAVETKTSAGSDSIDYGASVSKGAEATDGSGTAGGETNWFQSKAYTASASKLGELEEFVRSCRNHFGWFRKRSFAHRSDADDNVGARHRCHLEQGVELFSAVRVVW
jgi:hypothetical protein